jgi:hypothetical protein
MTRRRVPREKRKKEKKKKGKKEKKKNRKKKKKRKKEKRVLIVRLFGTYRCALKNSGIMKKSKNKKN